MPFPRLNIKFRKAFGSCQRLAYDENITTGICIPKKEPCNKKLPAAENFEIQNQIRAGVTLKETNTKILNTNELDINALSNAIEKTLKTKKTTKKTTTTKE